MIKQSVLLLALFCSVSAAEEKTTNQISHYDKQTNTISQNYRLYELPQAQQTGMQAIIELIKSHKIDEAMRLNDKLIKTIERLLDKKQTLHNKKGTFRAIASYPDDPMTLLNLLNLANTKQQGYLVSRDWLIPYYLRAYMLIEKKDTQAAMKALNRALEFSPYDPQVLSERGHLYNISKDWNNAEKDFTLALEMAKLLTISKGDSISFQGRALRGLGYIAVERKQWDKAVEFYHQALKINPNDKGAQNELKYIEQNRHK